MANRFTLRIPALAAALLGGVLAGSVALAQPPPPGGPGYGGPGGPGRGRGPMRGPRQATAAQLPVKLRQTVAVHLGGTLLIVRSGRRILLRQSDTARRMAGFWDLPAPEDLPGARLGAHLGEIRHTITHRHYTLTVRSAAAARPSSPLFRWFTADQLGEIHLSTTARKALKLVRIP